MVNFNICSIFELLSILKIKKLITAFIKEILDTVAIKKKYRSTRVMQEAILSLHKKMPAYNKSVGKQHVNNFGIINIIYLFFIFKFEHPLFNI